MAGAWLFDSAYLRIIMGTQLKKQKAGRARVGLLKLISTAILFPLRVRRRYLRFNYVLWEAAQEGTPNSDLLNTYRKNNIKILNIFIHLPLALCAIGSIYALYSEMETFIKFTRVLLTLPSIDVFSIAATTDGIRNHFIKVYRSFTALGLYKIGLTFLGLYFLSFLGSVFLSINPGWKRERDIERALVNNRYTDANGDPWEVYWTPEVLIFHTYNCDPQTFVANSKFWNTINFKPDIPYQYLQDSNKLIIARAYTLPAIIPFVIDGKIPGEND